MSSTSSRRASSDAAAATAAAAAARVPPPSFEAFDHPTRGRGLRATRAILPGEEVFRDEPTAIVLGANVEHAAATHECHSLVAQIIAASDRPEVAAHVHLALTLTLTLTPTLTLTLTPHPNQGVSALSMMKTSDPDPSFIAARSRPPLPRIRPMHRFSMMIS